MHTKKKIENMITHQLEDRNFEDILEDFDLVPEEVFWMLFKQGLIDIELLNNLYEVEIEED